MQKGGKVTYNANNLWLMSLDNKQNSMGNDVFISYYLQNN